MMDHPLTLSRPWLDQALPAPLLPATLAETLALGLLRRESPTRAAVGAGPELVRRTLALAGINTSVMLLTGPAQLGGSDVCYQTDTPGAERFDTLLGQVLAEPGPADEFSGNWLRQRTLSLLRLQATSELDSYVVLPDLDARWLSTGPPTLPPRLARWILQGIPLLLAGIGLLDAYIYNAGPSPSLLPLLLLPLLGSLAFGGWLFYQLFGWRKSLAIAWLARPVQLRPDSTRVAGLLTRAPWTLLWGPPLLLLTSFFVVILLLTSGPKPTLSVMIGPFLWALFGQVVMAVLSGRHYLKQSRTILQGLPAPLLPSGALPPAFWQSYRYY